MPILVIEDEDYDMPELIIFDDYGMLGAYLYLPDDVLQELKDNGHVELPSVTLTVHTDDGH